MIDPLYSVSGFAVGLLVGMTGVGGGSLMTPLLILLFGIHPATAVGTDLVYSAITKIVGAWVHFRQETVDLAMVLKLASGSVPAGLLGAVVVAMLPGFTHDTDRYVQRAIGALLVLVAALLLLRVSPFPSVRPKRSWQSLSGRKALLLSATGLFTGLGIRRAIRMWRGVIPIRPEPTPDFAKRSRRFPPLASKALRVMSHNCGAV